MTQGNRVTPYELASTSFRSKQSRAPKLSGFPSLTHIFRKHESILTSFSFGLCGLFVVTYVAIWPQPTKAPNSILQLQPLESSQGQLRANKAEPLLISNSASKGSALALVSSIRLSTGGDDVVVSTAAKANRDGVVGEDFTDDAAVKHVAPALGRDMITGELVISTYGTLSFPGEGQSCQEIGGSMLRDLDLPEETLDVLIHADEITVVRICATNGSVVMTCRNDLITINRRGPRPDDKCNQEI